MVAVVELLLITIRTLDLLAVYPMVVVVVLQLVQVILALVVTLVQVVVEVVVLLWLLLQAVGAQEKLKQKLVERVETVEFL